MTPLERFRRWRWALLHRLGRFERGRVPSPEETQEGPTQEGPTQQGRATFAGNLSAQVLRGGKNADS